MQPYNMLEELKRYFRETPKEEVLRQWEETKDLDEVGPTVEEFLEYTEHFYKTTMEDPLTDKGILNEKLSPEFTSGFFNLN